MRPVHLRYASKPIYLFALIKGLQAQRPGQGSGETGVPSACINPHRFPGARVNSYWDRIILTIRTILSDGQRYGFILGKSRLFYLRRRETAGKPEGEPAMLKIEENSHPGKEVCTNNTLNPDIR